MPSDSISVDGACASSSETTEAESLVRSRLNKHVRGESSPGHHTKGQSQRSKSSTSRYLSASSALEHRSNSTPESFLQMSSPSPNSTPRGGRTPVHENRFGLLPASQTALSSTRTTPTLSTQTSDQTTTATATFEGKNYRPSRDTTDGKVCLHTHHHHYWIMSGSVPKLRSSRERMPLQQAEESSSSKFDGTMDAWPDESDVEAMVEAERPPSRDTNRRYLVED